MSLNNDMRFAYLQKIIDQKNQEITRLKDEKEQLIELIETKIMISMVKSMCIHPN
jgi:hypothetical protein